LSTAGDLSPLEYRSAVEDDAFDNEPVYAGLRLSTWLKVGFIAVVFCALFWPNLRRLWDKTNPFYGEANWGHAICVPLIGLYYLYVNREELLKIKPKPMLWGRFLRWQRVGVGAALVPAGLGFFYFSRTLLGDSIFATALQGLGAVCVMFGVLVLAADWGLASLFTGLLVYTYGIYPGQNDFIKDFGMVVTLFGTVLVLCGWDVMKIVWFPIAFLVCAIPWPGLVYSLIAGPLQVLAAHAAVATLQLTGVTSFQGGTKIFIEGYGGEIRTLNVAEACAGLRSLMTFISVGAAVAFLSGRPLWQKLFLTAMSVPIAIMCNVGRVSGQGLLDHYVSQQLSESFAHQFVGMIMLVPAFFLILLMAWMLDKIFVDELDQRAAIAATHRLAVPIGAGGFAIPIPRNANLAALTGTPRKKASRPRETTSRPREATSPEPVMSGLFTDPMTASGSMGSIKPPPPAGDRPALRRATATPPREKPRAANRIPEPPKSMRVTPPASYSEPAAPDRNFL